MKLTIDYKFPLLWALAILVLSVIPTIETPSFGWMAPDKLIHVIFYTIFTFLICRAFQTHNTTKSHLQYIAISLIVSILYGGAIELIQQYLVPWRSGDRYDFAADGFGAVLGSLIFLYFWAKSNKIKQNGLKEES